MQQWLGRSSRWICCSCPWPACCVGSRSSSAEYRPKESGRAFSICLFCCWMNYSWHSFLRFTQRLRAHRNIVVLRHCGEVASLWFDGLSSRSSWIPFWLCFQRNMNHFDFKGFFVYSIPSRRCRAYRQNYDCYRSCQIQATARTNQLPSRPSSEPKYQQPCLQPR